MASLSTLSSESSVRSECNLPTTVKDDMLSPHIISAAIEVRRLLGDDLYDEILAEAFTDELPQSDPNIDLNNGAGTLDLNDASTDKVRAVDCCKAENILAFAYALPYLNIETSGRGIVRAKGWDSSRSELMSVGEIRTMVTDLREQAMNLLNPYLPVEDNDLTDEEEMPILTAGGMTFISI
jgi:hypothetical protein